MAIESLGEVDSPAGTLRCTLRAWEEVNATFGSYTAAFERVAAVDMIALARVVSIGTGAELPKAKDAVFRNGVRALVQPVTRYLELLSNGGKPIEDQEPQEGEG